MNAAETNELIRIIAELDDMPAKHEKWSREEAAKANAQHPELAVYNGDRLHAFEVGLYQGATKNIAARLRWLLGLGIVALALAGCVSEDAKPEPEIPRCVDIGAPDTLLCTADGLCSWAMPDGEIVECCTASARSEKCEAKP